MPIIKSAVKRVRQTKVRTARNNVLKRRINHAERQLAAALETGKPSQELPVLLANLQGKLDTAVKKRLVHKRNAARKLSRYAKLVSATGIKPAKTVKTAARKRSRPATKPAAKPARKSKPAAKPKKKSA